MRGTVHSELIAMLQNWCETNAPNRSCRTISVHVLLSHLAEADFVPLARNVVLVILIGADEDEIR